MDTIQKPKLTECKSLQEAIQVLNVRRAPPIFRKYVDMAFNIKDETGSIAKKMLQEAENDLQKNEDEKAKHEMQEMEHKKEHPNTGMDEKHGKYGKSEMVHTETEDNRMTGDSAQSDGRTLEEQKDKAKDTGSGSTPAQSQTGTDQLGEAIDQVADQGSIDPMNTCVIGKMSSGMSEVEAQNACAKEQTMMEGIVAKVIQKKFGSAWKTVDKNFKTLQEGMKTLDSKVENARKPELTDKGLSEGVNLQNVPAAPGQTKNNKFDKLKDPTDLAIYQRELTERYLQS